MCQCVESYFINSSHINELYNQISVMDEEQLIHQATKSRKEKSIEKYINMTHQAREKESRKVSSGRHINVGGLSAECRSNYENKFNIL